MKGRDISAENRVRNSAKRSRLFFSGSNIATLNNGTRKQKKYHLSESLARLPVEPPLGCGVRLFQVERRRVGTPRVGRPFWLLDVLLLVGAGRRRRHRPGRLVHMSFSRWDEEGHLGKGVRPVERVVVPVEDAPAVVAGVGRSHGLGLGAPAGGDVAGPSWVAPHVYRPAQARQELEEERVHGGGRVLRNEGQMKW